MSVLYIQLIVDYHAPNQGAFAMHLGSTHGPALN